MKCQYFTWSQKIKKFLNNERTGHKPTKYKKSTQWPCFIIAPGLLKGSHDVSGCLVQPLKEQLQIHRKTGQNSASTQLLRLLPHQGRKEVCTADDTMCFRHRTQRPPSWNSPKSLLHEDELSHQQEELCRLPKDFQKREATNSPTQP